MYTMQCFKLLDPALFYKEVGASGYNFPVAIINLQVELVFFVVMFQLSTHKVVHGWGVHDGHARSLCLYRLVASMALLACMEIRHPYTSVI